MHRPEREGTRGSTPSLRLMLGAMARYPVISAAEECELWRRYRVEHDPCAGERLILANLRFVVMIARQYRTRGVPMSDLIQEGNVGLIKAVQRFRPDMGYRLTSYAVWWIRSQIQSYILGSYSVVKLGTSRAQRKVFFCLARARRELHAASGAAGDPLVEDLEELARKLGVKVEELDEVLHRMEHRDVSIESRDLGASAIGESCPWPPEPGAAEGHDDGERMAALREGLDRLCPRDRLIVESRFICAPPVKLRALATQLGVTTARVYQLEVRAVQRLREALLAGAADAGAIDGRRSARFPEKVRLPAVRELRLPGPRRIRTANDPSACPACTHTADCHDCPRHRPRADEPQGRGEALRAGEAELGA